jgi:LacI family transcriptional regulator
LDRLVGRDRLAERLPAARMRERCRQRRVTDAERLRGYLDALDDAGIRFDPDLVMVGEKTELRATEEVARMLALPERATAIFCTETDAMTGTLRAVRAAGLAYPADVSLIGFDDSSWAAVMDPPLTMIAQPMHALGSQAAATLLALIDGEETSRSRHTLETLLVPRASVAPPPAA